MVYCRHRVDTTTRELCVTTPKGTDIVVPIDRLRGSLAILAQPQYNALYRASELTVEMIQQLVDDAEEIKPGPGIDLSAIKRRTLEERHAEDKCPTTSHHQNPPSAPGISKS
jgi:hypothetical protein